MADDTTRDETVSSPLETKVSRAGLLKAGAVVAAGAAVTGRGATYPGALALITEERASTDSVCASSLPG